MSKLIVPNTGSPGVYIQEVPSGNHSIVGVPTSVTAFLGRTPMGPVGEPVQVTSASGLHACFGDPQGQAPLTRAVWDFFNNGGQTAVIVRLEAGGSAGVPAGVTLDASGAPSVRIRAASPGTWGDQVHVQIQTPETVCDKVLTELNDGLPDGASPIVAGDVFDLIVRGRLPGSTQPFTERFDSVVLRSGTQRSLQSVLSGASSYVRADVLDQGTRPDDTDAPTPLAGGVDSGPLSAQDYIGDRGLARLDRVESLNTICIPPDTPNGQIDDRVWQSALAYAQARRAFVIVDPPPSWHDALPTGTLPDQVSQWITDLSAGETARFGMVYFPRIRRVDPVTGVPSTGAACGCIAGIQARTDASRGVWHAPAGMDATLDQIAGLAAPLNDSQNGALNRLGVVCLRTFDLYGHVVWGDRTLRGQAALNDTYAYVSVRRLTNYLEVSLQQGLRWTVFEPNDATLWGAVRASVDGFLGNLQAQGAFYSYQVQCDANTTTAQDVEQGLVNVVIQFAPVKPAEFVVLYLQLIAASA